MININTATMKYTQKDYMYDRMGPWPQPNPVLPFGEFPAVLHVPKAERRRLS